MLKLIRKDLAAYATDGRWITKVKFIFFSHGFHMGFFIRAGIWFRKSIPFLGSVLAWMCEYTIRVVYASDISTRAKIGGGLQIMHGHDIVIGAKVVIGENVKIFNGVTLGGKDTEILDEQPRVGDNVIISTGAKILGGITIGKNSIIGANSVVIKPVEENSKMVGVPARFIGPRYTTAD